MKKIFYLVFFSISLNLSGQTDSIEKAAIYDKLTSKRISPTEFANTCNQWNQKLKVNPYPNQPLDQNRVVHFVFVNEFKGFDREYLFNRTLEWLSVNYGLLPSGIYSNLKDGKIIFRISLNLVNNYSCIPTTIISVINEKIRVEYISITYQVFYQGNYEEGIPERTVDLKVYPVIIKKPNEWDLNLSLLRETNKLFRKEVQNLTEYVTSYENSKVF